MNNHEQPKCALGSPDFRNVGLEKTPARESLIGRSLSGLTMRPLVLTLKGFRGIRDGLGRDELRLDFEQLAGDAALVAIAGANGRGKSTILDNMTPTQLCLRAPAPTAWGARRARGDQRVPDAGHCALPRPELRPALRDIVSGRGRRCARPRAEANVHRHEEGSAAPWRLPKRVLRVADA